ncbi:22699_t:CDS:2 [Dentiscutata erythropus]|uniref:22699_t:CDS:1 n=1 Tax=Dentiscutata erythropus TaxID=1348616 RepID=A0A9N9FK92_9GLOM|nr:22699_t:CDS:2 [Dentiscutata erythropus]
MSRAIWCGDIKQGPWFSGYDLGINSKDRAYCHNWGPKPHGYKKLIRNVHGQFTADEYEFGQISQGPWFGKELGMGNES